MVNSDAPGSEDGHSDPIDPIDPEIENAVNYVISNEAQILLDMLPSRSSNLWDNADDYEDYLNAEVDDADDDDELTMGEDEEYLNAEVDIGEDDDEITIGDDEGEDEEEYDDDDDAELWEGERESMPFLNLGGDEEDEDNEEEDRQVDDEDMAAMRLLALLRAGARSGLLTRAQVATLLTSNEMGDLSNWDHRLGLEAIFGGQARGPPKDPTRFPKVPSEEGSQLMRSGAFGANDDPILRTKKRVARRLLDRELGVGDGRERTRNADVMAQSMIPGTKAEQVIHYDDPIYSGQFSDDGNFFFSCCQDFNVRLYDTSNPYNWKHYKTVSYPWGQWTLTDASLSPDNRWLAYTSIQSIVSMAPTDPNDKGDPYSLDLDNGAASDTHSSWRHRDSFGIWSVRFSGDGRELVAGTSSHSIVVYDIESRRVLHHIDGHDDDVNAVCFADKSSPHILYSGSDDTTIKVWDRRSMGDGREAGAFVGHIEGLTYIDSKGDGRYILSNGKDQSMKLWDLRMVMSTARHREINANRHSRLGTFDYRRESYDQEDWDVHPHDNSLVTFRGHKVLRTLIRCHFSPPSATNSRYVYSGSADGKVFVWNMDATIAGTIDVRKATTGTRRRDGRTRMYIGEPGNWNTCVRDASWHPSAPMIVASAWNGYSMARGTCSIHSFNESSEDEGDPQMGRSVDEMLQPDPEVFFKSSY